MTFIKASRLKELEKIEWEFEKIKTDFTDKIALATEIATAKLEIEFAHAEHEQAERFTGKMENMVTKFAEIAKENVTKQPTVINNG